jgi:hypothetical protein
VGEPDRLPENFIGDELLNTVSSTFPRSPQEPNFPRPTAAGEFGLRVSTTNRHTKASAGYVWNSFSFASTDVDDGMNKQILFFDWKRL